MHFAVFNSRSLVNKFTQLQHLVYTSHFDIIGITETWLSSSIFDNEILPTNYSIFRRDRCGRGGGVLLAVRNPIEVISVFSHPTIELLTVVLSLPLLLTVCIVYIPPNASNVLHLSLHDYICQLVSHSLSEVLIIGDFNYPNISWSTLSGGCEMSDLFCDLMFDIGLHQHVSSATHIKGKILDLVITVSPDLVQDLVVHANEEEVPLTSDHFLIFLSDSGKCPKQAPRQLRDFSKADLNGLCSFLLDQDFGPCLASSDVQFVWSVIKRYTNRGLDLDKSSAISTLLLNKVISQL